MLVMYSPSLAIPSWLQSLLMHAAPTALPTLSLHDALPISHTSGTGPGAGARDLRGGAAADRRPGAGLGVLRLAGQPRSEEHTSELQSRGQLVCRLLLEKKKGRLSRERGRASRATGA